MERVRQMLEIRGYNSHRWGFGPTEAAVKALQLGRGLEVDGEVDPDTW